MRTLGSQRRVVAVSRVDDCVIVVDAEDPRLDVAEEFLEGPRLPRLTHPAREPRGAAERLENPLPGYFDTRLCETMAV